MACAINCDGCARLLRRWPEARQPEGICAVVDREMLELLSEELGHPVTFAEARRVHATIGRNLAKAEAFIRTHPLPHHAVAFELYAKDIHAHFLSDTGLRFAARFRDRDGHYGEASRGLKGTPPDQIQRKIWELADRSVPADADGFQAHHFARAGARIIHGFLRIHPFADVNGRVARMLFRALVLRSGGRFEPLPTDEREEGDRRDQYLAALRSADDILRESEGTSHEANAHDLLADWLLPMVMPVVSDEDEGASRGF